MRIGVVIPTFNEELRIGKQVERAIGISGIGEVIVVDGGSTDRTVQVATASGATVISASKGRASQMNAGAQATNCEAIVFLHADVVLPGDAASWILQTLADRNTVAGAFRTWTVSEGPRRWLAPFLHLADLRSRYSKEPYGDQALFVRADAFRAVGGFPLQALMEDLELSRRLRRIGRLHTVPARVRVSGRRFEARPLYYLVVTNTFPLLYRFGVSVDKLARLYGAPR